ncbi:MAG: prolyl-tRNA synthetase [Candidatus Pacebacteria bacterium]|nr:prolyl-tRNA synthetase [Candidatus Paceibacterota bacterium]
MKQSKFFTKTRKEKIKDEASLNADLLMRAGFVNKEMAGVYSFLPMGLKVLRKIENIIREEMTETMGAHEVLMPALHPLKNYEATGRDKIDVLFYTKLNSGGDLVLGQSHEEIVTPLLKNFVSSYKDLPCGVFQVQTKFRNELRSKSGILRGREFLMKDLYSFHATQECFEEYYEKSKVAYHNIFRKLGIGDITFISFASGGTFSKYSHEFQTISEIGEDEIYFCSDCKVAINKEIIDDSPECPECGKKKADLEVKRSIEVGNIFPLSTRFSDSFNLTYKDENGEEKPVYMGCYGIGVSRVMGTIVEIFADEKGIVWPKEIAPFHVHLISFNKNEETEKIYKELLDVGVDVLYDDRDKSPGEKMAESDLIGIPYRMIVSEKTLENKTVEVKKRNEDDVKFINISEITDYVKKII